MYFARSPRVSGCRGLAANSAMWSSVTTALLKVDGDDEWANRHHCKSEVDVLRVGVGVLHRRSVSPVTGLESAITCTHGGRGVTIVVDVGTVDV